MSNLVKTFKLKMKRTSDEDRCVKFNLHTVFYEGVKTLGCSPFQSAQAEACQCDLNMPNDPVFNGYFDNLPTPKKKKV